MEPVFDPTRRDASVDVTPLRISAGSASLFDVFGERWHLASDDALVELEVSSLGLAWRTHPTLPCDVFTKRHDHDGGEATLAPLSPDECERIRGRQSRGFDDAAPVAVIAAPTTVPAFAAPLPGSRLSSSEFWAAQKARIETIEAELKQKRLALVPHRIAAEAEPLGPAHF